MRLTRVASRFSAGESAKTGSDDEDGATGALGDVSEMRMLELEQEGNGPTSFRACFGGII